MRDIHLNVLYHFYALSCYQNRLSGKPEEDFASFVKSLNWLSSRRIEREEFILRLWRENLHRRNVFKLFLASIMDPRRTAIRFIRFFDRHFGDLLDSGPG